MYLTYITLQKKPFRLGEFQTLLDALQAVDFLRGNLKDPSGQFTIDLNPHLFLEGELSSNGIIYKKLEDPRGLLDLSTLKIYKNP